MNESMPSCYFNHLLNCHLVIFIIGTCHPKLTILALFTHLHVFPNRYDFISHVKPNKTEKKKHHTQFKISYSVFNRRQKVIQVWKDTKVCTLTFFLGDLFKDNLFYINSQQVIFLSFYICLFSCLAFPIHSPAPRHKDPPCKSPNPVIAVWHYCVFTVIEPSSILNRRSQAQTFGLG